MTNANASATAAAETKTPKAVAAEYAIPDQPFKAKISLGVLNLAFGDGTKVTVAAENLSPEILSQALMHGLKAKLVDAAAISRSPDTGKSATFADKKDAVLAVLTRLQSGQWNKTREAGDTGSKGSMLLEAVCRLYADKEPAKVEQWLGTQNEAQITAIKKNPRVVAILAAIKAERAAKAAEASGVDGDDLLAELDAFGEEGEASGTGMDAPM